MIKKTLLVFLVALFLSSPAYSSNKNPKRILILNSYHDEFPWTENEVGAAKEVLHDKFPHMELYVEYLDTKRIYNEVYLKSFFEIFLMKYKEIDLDGIIVTDDNALSFILKHRNRLKGKPPIVYCGINFLEKHPLEGVVGVTGYVEKLDIKETLLLIKKLHPQTKKIVVVADNTPTGRGQKKEILKVVPEFSDLEFEFLDGNEYRTQELKEKLMNLSSDTVVLLAVWLRDRYEEYISAEEGGEEIFSVVNVPVYGLIDLYLGHGIIGGKLLTSRQHGRLAAELLVKLMGRKVNLSDYPLDGGNINRYMFDYHQLKRWGIDPAQLPEHSLIVNQPFSPYQKYKVIIWIVVVALFCLVFIVAALSYAIYKRNLAQKALQQREKELRESEQKFRSIGENAKDFIFIKDKSRCYRYVNKAMQQLFNLPEEEIMGKTPEEIFGPQQGRIVNQVDDRSFDGEIVDEIRRLSIGDKQYYFHTIQAPLEREGREVKSIVGIVRDITELKASEEKLAEMNKNLEKLVNERTQQLIQTERLAALGSLSASVAHEINNPLQAIASHLGNLKNRFPDELEGNGSYKHIVNSVKSIKVIVKQLLDVYRAEDTNDSDFVDINQIIEDVGGLIENQMKVQDVKMEFALSSELPLIKVNKRQIHQVILNLLLNAAESIEGKGKVTVSTEFQANELVVTIADTGKGIGKENIEKLFEPFFSTKGVAGVGLGLFVCHNIIQTHKGKITVASEEGKGSVFKVILPKGDEDE